MAGNETSRKREVPQEVDDEWIEGELHLLQQHVEQETVPERLMELALRLEQLVALRRRRR